MPTKETALSPEMIAAIQDARRAEKEHALFYRALASAAEDRRDADLAEALNGLHADEQHHLSRLTVRLVELSAQVDDLGSMQMSEADLATWRDEAHKREQAEIDRYERMLEMNPDTATHDLLVQILETERAHAATLGGKFMPA